MTLTTIFSVASSGSHLGPTERVTVTEEWHGFVKKMGWIIDLSETVFICFDLVVDK